MAVIAALILVQVIYASGVIVGKYILPIVPAPVIVTLRMLIASTAFYAAHRAYRGKVPSFGPDWARFALLGVLGGAGNQLLILLGLTRTTAINTAMLIPMIPIFTVIFGWLLRLDRPSRLKWGGVAVAAAGTVYLIGPERVSLGADLAVGNLLVLTGMAFNALAFLLSKDLLRRYPPVTVAFCLTIAGLLGVLPLGVHASDAVETGMLTSRVLLWLLYLVVFPTTVTYFLNLWSLRQVSPVLVTSFIYLQPLFVTGVAPLVLEGERLTLPVAIAGLTIFAGVGLVLAGESVNSQQSTVNRGVNGNRRAGGSASGVPIAAARNCGIFARLNARIPWEGFLLPPRARGCRQFLLPIHRQWPDDSRSGLGRPKPNLPQCSVGWRALISGVARRSPMLGRSNAA